VNKDTISAVVMAVAVVAVVVGFGVYFNSPGLNESALTQQQLIENKFVSVATTTNGTMKTIKLIKAQFLQIDKSQFQKAPEFTQIAGYINTAGNTPRTIASLKGEVVLVDFRTYTCIALIVFVLFLILTIGIKDMLTKVL